LYLLGYVGFYELQNSNLKCDIRFTVGPSTEYTAIQKCNIDKKCSAVHEYPGTGKYYYTCKNLTTGSGAQNGKFFSKGKACINLVST
jgi:hypothetical protein